jgi:hypothetical protein
MSDGNNEQPQSNNTAAQLARIDERTLHMGREMSDLKMIQERHRVESRQGNEELKALLAANVKALNDKNDTQDQNIADGKTEHEVLKAKTGRNDVWMYGIFLAAWGGFLTWMKSTGKL